MLESLDLDFVCNGDEYAEKGALPAIVSMCENSSVPCHVNLVHKDISDAALDRLRKAFGKLCPTHTIDMYAVPDRYTELVDATIVPIYGVDCLKLFLHDIVPHKGDVFVYNDCDTLTVGDIGKYASECVDAGLGDRYVMGISRNMGWKKNTQFYQYMAGFFMGSDKGFKDGGFTDDVVKRMLVEAPVCPSMHYISEAACLQGRVLDVSPYWVFTRFWWYPPEKLSDDELNSIFSDPVPLGYEPYSSEEYERFVKCYHFSGENKPWVNDGRNQPTAGVEAWRKYDARCQEAMND